MWGAHPWYRGKALGSVHSAWKYILIFLFLSILQFLIMHVFSFYSINVDCKYNRTKGKSLSETLRPTSASRWRLLGSTLLCYQRRMTISHSSPCRTLVPAGEKRELGDALFPQRGTFANSAEAGLKGNQRVTRAGTGALGLESHPQINGLWVNYALCLGLHLHLKLWKEPLGGICSGG